MQRRDFLKGFGLVLGAAGSGIGVSTTLGAVTKEISPAPGTVTEKCDYIIGIHEVDWSLKLEKFLNKEFPIPEGKFSPAHSHCAFVIKDNENHLSLDDLIRIHFDPALCAMARPYNNGEVFPVRDRLLPECDRSPGLIQCNSLGGRIPIRCTLSYDVKTSITVVELAAIGIELSKSKTSIPSRAPTVIGDYPAGHNGWIGTTDSNWQTGDMVRFHDECYTIICQPYKNKLELDRPLVKPIEHGMPAIYAGSYSYKFTGWDQSDKDE